MRFDDAGIVITGAGRGLGAAVSKEFARLGGRLALIARTGSEIERTRDDILREGGKAFTLQADIADKRSIYPLAGTIHELLGRVDLVVHNASSLGATPLRRL